MASAGAVLGTLSLVVFLRVLGVFLVLVGFVDHWVALGGARSTAGVGFGAYAFALALFLLPLGWVSDRVGPRRVMVAALLVSAAGGLLAAFATTAPLFALGRFVQGMGAVNGVALAVVGEIGDPAARTRRMAALGASAGAAVVIGLVLSASVSRLGVSIPEVLLGFSVATLLVVPLVATTVPARMASPEGAPDAGALRVALLLGAGAFAVNLGLTGFLLFLRDLLAAAAPGLGFEVALVVMLLPAGLGMYVAARLADRGRTRAVGVAAGALLALAPLPFLLPSGAVVVLAAGILYFAGHSSMTSLLPSLASRLAPAGRRGFAQGVQSTLQYLGSAVGASLVGVLFASGWTFAMAVAFVAAGLLASLVVVRATRTPA